MPVTTESNPVLTLNRHGLTTSEMLTPRTRERYGEAIDAFADLVGGVVENAERDADATRRNKDLTAQGRTNALDEIGKRAAAKIDEAAEKQMTRVAEKAKEARKRLNNFDFVKPDVLPEHDRVINQMRFATIQRTLEQLQDRASDDPTSQVLMGDQLDDLNAGETPRTAAEIALVSAAAAGDAETLIAVQAAPLLWRQGHISDTAFRTAVKAYFRTTSPDAYHALESAEEAERSIDVSADQAVARIGKAADKLFLKRPSKLNAVGV